MQIFKYNDSDLSFSIPDNWVFEREKNLISVYEPHDGVGALQFSIYYIDEDRDISLQSELIEFLNGKHSKFEVKNILNYVYCFLNENGTYWKYWLFRKNIILVFATYNCAMNDADKESEVIERIIQSASQ